MNSIVKLTTTLKHGGEYGLSGLDLFIGPNGSGKSTLIQSLEFLATGKITGVKQQDLPRFAPDTGLAVGVQLSGNVYLRRELVNGKTAIEFDPGYGDRTIAEKQDRLTSTFGSSYLLNLHEITALPAPEQKRRLLAICSTTLSQSDIQAILGEDNWNALKHLWKGDPDAFLAKARRSAHDNQVYYTQRCREVRQEIENTPDAELSPCIEELDEAKRVLHDLKGQQARYESTAKLRQRVQDLESKLAAPTPPNEDIKSLEEDVSSLQEALNELQVVGNREGIRQVLATGTCPLHSGVKCPYSMQDWRDRLANDDSNGEAIDLLHDEYVRAKAHLNAAKRAWDQYARDLEDQNLYQKIYAEVIDELNATDSTEDVSSAIARQEDLVESLQRRQDAHQRHFDKLVALDTLEREKANARLLEASVDESSELSMRVLQAGFRPFVSAANELMGLIGWNAKLLTPGVDVGIGIERDGVQVPWEALSTGERTQLSIIVSLCLIEIERPTCPIVMLDNFEALDEVAQLQTANLLKSLYDQGKIANAIMASTRIPEQPLAGWTYNTATGTGEWVVLSEPANA